LNVSSKLVLLKIGGNLASPKDKFREVDYRNIEEVVKVIKYKFNQGYNFIILHGGGSHAHTPSRCYGLTRILYKDNALGLSLTKLLLKELNLEICKIFIRYGLPILMFDTCSLIRHDNTLDLHVIDEAIKSRFIPILHGDITVIEHRSFIISSDDLALILAKKYRPDITIFIIRERGIVDRYGNTIRRVTPDILKDLMKTEENMNYVDVTGGIMKKLNVCFEISKICKVYICPPEFECLCSCIDGFECDRCSLIETSN